MEIDDFIRDIDDFAKRHSLCLPCPDLTGKTEFCDKKSFANELSSIYSSCFEESSIDKRCFNAIANQIIKGYERNNSLEQLNNYTLIVRKFYNENSVQKIFSDWGILFDRTSPQEPIKIKSWDMKWTEITVPLKKIINIRQENYWHILAGTAYLFCKYFKKASYSYERMLYFIWVKFYLRESLKIHFAYPFWDRVFSRNIELNRLIENWQLLSKLFNVALSDQKETKRSHNFFLEEEKKLKESRHSKDSKTKYNDLWNASPIKKYLDENHDILDDLCRDLNTSTERITEILRRSVMGIAMEGCEQFISEYEKSFLKMMEHDELKIELFTLITHLSFGLSAFQEWQSQEDGKLGGRGNKKKQS